MAATSDYLAFDLGASSGRAVLGRFDGERLKLEEIRRFANGPIKVHGHLYWDILRLFEEIKLGLTECAARQKQLDGIGIDAWGVDYALLSATGELLGLPYHYRDPRTLGMFEEAFRRVPREEIYAQTGIQFLELNTLYQLLATALSDRVLLELADTLLFTPDLLNYWLTGVKQAEYTIASTSQLYKASGAGWATDLISKLGLPTKIMPSVVAPGTLIGELLPEIVEETGLGPTAVLAPACHDTADAVAAVPARGENWAYISSGTWSLIGAEVSEPICGADALASNFTNEGGVAATIRFLKNLAGLWLVQECQRTWAARGAELSFLQLTDLASSAAALTSFVDPDDPRFAEPGDMARRIQEFCADTGQPVPQSKGQIVRCVLESLAFKYRVSIDTLQRLTGRGADVIHIVGGGVNNRLLCQLTADATGRPVVAGPAEATAAGNIMVQALARGRVASLDQVREVIARSASLEHYEPSSSKIWQDACGRFEALLTCGRPE